MEWSDAYDLEQQELDIDLAAQYELEDNDHLLAHATDESSGQDRRIFQEEFVENERSTERSLPFRHENGEDIAETIMLRKGRCRHE